MNTIRSAALFAGIVLAIFSGRVCAQVPPPSAAGVTYGVVGGQPLQLDLYIPTAGTAPRPVCLWIHGGGWRGGSRAPIPAWFVAMMNRGMAVASVSYRFTTDAEHWGNELVTFPAQIHDVKGAVRFLRAHAADYGLDPARVVVWGASAGGHLASLLATSSGVPGLEGDVGGNLEQSSAVLACVNYMGPLDFLNLDPDVTTPPGSVVNHDTWSSSQSYLIGWSQPGQGIEDIRAHLTDPTPPYPALVDRVRQANPITHVDPSDPPILCVHGTMDTIVPFHQSERMRDAMLAAGAHCELLAVPGAGHGNFSDVVYHRSSNFLLERIGLALIPVPPPDPDPDPHSCAADLDGDGQVGSPDLAALLGTWGGSGPADITGDGLVNSADLATLLGAWGPCP